jgi:hypothetical protein
MPLLSLGLEKRPSIPPRQEKPRAVPFTFTYKSVSQGSWPGRGLLYSSLIHEIALFALILGPAFRRPVEPPRPPEEFRMLDLRATKEVLYLPQLGGGSEGGGHAGGRSGAARNGSPGTPARGTKGVSYLGPQPMLSDPPNPTNAVQTILQPGLVNPPELKPLIPLPNLVQMADAGPAPVPPVEPMERQPVAAVPEPPLAPPPPVTPEPTVTMPDLPVFKAESVPPLEAPKLELPTNAPQNSPLQAQAKPPEPVAKPVEAPVAKPPESRPPPQFSPLPTSGKDLHNLLSLSPLPAPPESSIQVPSGETRGRFAISPEINPNIERAGPGSKVEKPPTVGIGIGDQTAAPAAAGNQTGVPGGTLGAEGLGQGRTGNGLGAGTGPGHGEVRGTIEGSGVGSGPGAGAGHGPGTGSGPGTGAGAGHGPGTGIGPGGGGFPGITIQGGRLETGAAGKPTARSSTPLSPQGSYSLTIVSTAQSGGGLADFGVFRHEQTYTVYVDVRRTAEDRTPSWTLQYAVLPEAAAQESAAKSSDRSREGLVPPFPTTKELPQWPVELLQKYPHKQIVVYAIIDKEGKFGQMLVKQTPSPQLNKPLLEALSKWVFRPGELDGIPIAVKVLLGIPLPLPD